MALRQDPVRLLIGDDVGIGKTIEAGLIARELYDRGEIRRLAVLCPPHLCEQWEQELRSKFHFDAVVVRPGTVSRLEKQMERADPARHVILTTATPHSGVQDAFASLVGLLDADLEQAVRRLEFGASTHPEERERLAQRFVQRRRADIRRYLNTETDFPERLTA